MASVATVVNVVVTVNGIPLNQYTNNQRPRLKLAPTEEELIARSVRSHIITRRMRNSSGSRSGRGRVIYSAVATA